MSWRAPWTALLMSVGRETGVGVADVVTRMTWAQVWLVAACMQDEAEAMRKQVTRGGVAARGGPRPGRGTVNERRVGLTDFWDRAAAEYGVRPYPNVKRN